MFKHKTLGTVTTTGSAWQHHAQDGKMLRAGVGQESLGSYVKGLKTDVGPAGTAAESAHTTLRAALTGDVIQAARPADIHTKLARALGHSGGIVLQETEDDTRPDPESVHEKLAKALRGW